MKTVTFRGRIVNLWEASVGWLAAFIIVGSVAGCAYLFLAPANANGSPVSSTGNDPIRTPTGQAGQASPPPDLKVVTDAKYGKILVTAQGQALYRRVPTHPTRPPAPTCARSRGSRRR